MLIPDNVHVYSTIWTIGGAYQAYSKNNKKRGEYMLENTGAVEAFDLEATTLAPTPKNGPGDAPSGLAPSKSKASQEVERPQRSSESEADDTYGGVVLRFTDDWRLVVCAEGRQWILQSRKAANDWRGRKHFSRAEHIPLVVKELVGKAAAQQTIKWWKTLEHSI